MVEISVEKSDGRQIGARSSKVWDRRGCDVLCGVGPAEDFKRWLAISFKDDALPAAAFAEEMEVFWAEQGRLAREEVKVVISRDGEGGNMGVF